MTSVANSLLSFAYGVGFVFENVLESFVVTSEKRDIVSVDGIAASVLRKSLHIGC